MKPKLFSVFVLLLLSLTSFALNDDVASDRAALFSFRAVLGGRSNLWNSTETNPCSWSGVKCVSNRVTELRAPGWGLSGPLPSSLGNLTQLRALSLRRNRLRGPIPTELSSLVNLDSLYLQGNEFSGEIPEVIFGLVSLERLDLSHNNFSGEISPGFDKLTKLVSLHLEENRLSGAIPELDLKLLGQFNVSYNELNGEVPRKLSGWPAETFVGNLALCGKPLAVVCNGINVSDKSGLSGGAIAGIVIGCVVGLVIIVAVLYLLCGRRRRGEEGALRDFEAVRVAKEAEGSSPEYSAVQKGNVNGKDLVFFGDVVKMFFGECLVKMNASSFSIICMHLADY